MSYRSSAIRVWREVYQILKYLAGKDDEPLQFQQCDLASVLILLGLSHPRIVDVLAEEFELNATEKNALTIKLEKIKKILVKEGVYYAEKEKKEVS